MCDLIDDVVLMCLVIDVLCVSGCDLDWVLVCVGLLLGGLLVGCFFYFVQNLFWKVVVDECGEEYVGLYLVEYLLVFYGLFLEYLFFFSDIFGVGLCYFLCYVCLLFDILQV